MDIAQLADCEIVPLHIARFEGFLQTAIGSQLFSSIKVKQCSWHVSFNCKQHFREGELGCRRIGFAAYPLFA